MILPVYAYGQPVLKEKAVDIDVSIYQDMNLLIQNMWDTMYAAKGVGLAAPQIGLAIKLFVIDTTPYEKNENGEKFEGIRRIFINAELKEESGTLWPFEEGCLSLPDIRAEVERPSDILISYIDELGAPKEERFSGLNARVIQHEYDHIQGILFIDHVKPLKKRMLQRRLEYIRKGQIEADYKLRFYRSK